MPSAPLPGFTGVTNQEVRQCVVLKTGVSQRLSLQDRAQQAARVSAQTPNPTSSAGGAAAARSYFLPKRHVGYTSYGDASQAFVRSASDVPPRASERGFAASASATSNTNLNASFEGTTTNKLATQGYAAPEEPDFFSRIRIQERRDDDARHSLEEPKTRSGAAKNLRCSAIQTKRETDPGFAPQPMSFVPVPRVRPNNLVTAHGSAGANAGKPVFTAAGSTHSLDFPDPRSNARAAVEVLQQKQGKTLLAPDRALVSCATSRDLFAGTGKASEDVASGYMGHVPANEVNISRVQGANDKLRAHMKTVDTVTAPTSNSTTSLLRAKFAAAQAAAEAQRGRPITPRTSAAYYTTQAASAAEERRINRVECGRKNAVRGFFSRGEGEQDDIVADQFCVRYRPLEGLMRHGPLSQQSWVSDTELRRSPRM